MDIYNYHPVTGELLGRRAAREDPLEPGRAVVPACATTEPPPTPPAGQVAVWADGAWTTVDDHRGETRYHADTGEAVTIMVLGPVPEGLLAEPPPPPPPPPIREITARSFMRRISDAKQLTITEAARTSAAVDLWLRKALAGPVELDHPETATGIDSLISVGLLTEADKVTLLADGTPNEAP